MKIERLSSGDVSTAKQLFLLFQQIDEIADPTEASDDYLKRLLSDPGFHVLTATSDGIVVGGITAYELPKYKRDETEIFLYELGVMENYRRKGVASALIDELLDLAAERQISAVFVATEADNIPAIELYRKTVGRPESAIFFTCDL